MQMIELDGIRYWQEGVTVLHDVSWHVQAGENWAVIGLNGSGKTTLLKMAAGYLFPSKGTVSVLGERLGSVDVRELRKRIGWVSSSMQMQLPNQDTALDVVISGRFASIQLWEKYTETDRERAYFLLESLGCARLADHRYGHLSQGERQKVMIARAWMNDPQLLIMDEPCTGLDVRSREDVLASIQGMADHQSPTILYVSHHIEEIMPLISQTLVMKDGSVHAAGTKKEILTPAILSEAFEIPVEVDWYRDRPWLRV